jgi:nucleoside-diphosphate-sugar epimerase
MPRLGERVSLGAYHEENRKMASVLFIGGTGQISLPCVQLAVEAGHKVSVLNRGQTSVPLPAGVATIVGDMNDAKSYAKLGDGKFDVVCQFRAYTPEQMQRDIATFAGKTGQYIFISSASAYQKPARHYIITERTPLENPYWEYSRNKATCEKMLRDQSKLTWTIVRPSHTVRTGMPIQLGDADAGLRRMIAGKPVIVTGDGTSLWTLTRCVDLAVPFVRLFGNKAALNDDFQITSDRAYTWDQIHTAIGRGFGVEAIHAHVPTDTLVRYNKAWEGPLTGDKSWSAVFDNTKIKKVAGPFEASTDLDVILQDSIMHAKTRLKSPATPTAEVAKEDALFDKIIAEQGKLGR